MNNLIKEYFNTTISKNQSLDTFIEKSNIKNIIIFLIYCFNDAQKLIKDNKFNYFIQFLKKYSNNQNLKKELDILINEAYDYYKENKDKKFDISNLSFAFYETFYMLKNNEGINSSLDEILETISLAKAWYIYLNIRKDFDIYMEKNKFYEEYKNLANQFSINYNLQDDENETEYINKINNFINSKNKPNNSNDWFYFFRFIQDELFSSSFLTSGILIKKRNKIYLNIDYNNIDLLNFLKINDFVIKTKSLYEELKKYENELHKIQMQPTVLQNGILGLEIKIKEINNNINRIEKIFSTDTESEFVDNLINGKNIFYKRARNLIYVWVTNKMTKNKEIQYL